MVLLRRDFVPPETRCAAPGVRACRRLTSGVAWILSDGAGEHPYGPACVKRYLGEEEFHLQSSRAPDFTSRDAESQTERSERVGAWKSGSGKVGAGDHDPARAACYLLLRMEKLAKVPGVSHRISAYEGLASVYSRYRQNRRLSDEDVALVCNLERSVQRSYYVMSHANLLDVYTGYRRLTFSISDARGKNRAFLESLRGYLLRELWLTDAQREKTGVKWLRSAFPADKRPGPRKPSSSAQ